MVFTNGLINQFHGDKSRKLTAREELWKAQGHNIFSYPWEEGISRPVLRRAAYRALLSAEKITREKTGFRPSLMNFDFNFDGENEYLFQDEKINCYVQLRGAGVFELDYLPKAWNYLDTFIPGAGDQKDRGLAFADCLLPPDFTRDDAEAGRFEKSRRCWTERYRPLEMDKVRLNLLLGLSENEGVPFGAIEMEKRFQLRKDTLTVHYDLRNGGVEGMEFLFSPALDISFPGDGVGSLRIFAGSGELKSETGGKASVSGADTLKFQDIKNEVHLILGSTQPFDAWIIPVRTAVYQSTALYPLQRAVLAPGASWETGFTLKITR
jgi:hypothetical protein